MRAFSQKCTHLGCVVYYEADERRAGTARATKATSTPRTGAVISGPPPRPLGRIDVEVRDGTVWALGAPPGDAPR